MFFIAVSRKDKVGGLEEEQHEVDERNASYGGTNDDPINPIF